MTASSAVTKLRKNGFAKPILSIVLWPNSNQSFKKSAGAAAEEEDEDDYFTREIITQKMSIITTRTRALISNGFSSSSSSSSSLDTQVWASKVLWDGLIHGSKSSQRNAVIMRRIIKQLAAEELTPAFYSMISSSFDLLPLVTETSELPSFTWRLICNNRQHTWAWKQAAKWWWWVWALCAMQACGMKNEERRETRQDKTRRAIRVGVINCVFHHYCNSAQCTNQLYMKYAPSSNPSPFEVVQICALNCFN